MHGDHRKYEIRLRLNKTKVSKFKASTDIQSYI